MRLLSSHSLRLLLRYSISTSIPNLRKNYTPKRLGNCVEKSLRKMFHPHSFRACLISCHSMPIMRIRNEKLGYSWGTHLQYPTPLQTPCFLHERKLIWHHDTLC